MKLCMWEWRRAADCLDGSDSRDIRRQPSPVIFQESVYLILFPQVYINFGIVLSENIRSFFIGVLGLRNKKIRQWHLITKNSTH